MKCDIGLQLLPEDADPSECHHYHSFRSKGSTKNFRARGNFDSHHHTCYLGKPQMDIDNVIHG